MVLTIFVALNFWQKSTLQRHLTYAAELKARYDRANPEGQNGHRGCSASNYPIAASAFSP